MEEISLNSNRTFSGLSLLLLALAALNLPSVAHAGAIDYRAVIIAKDSAGTTLGYLTDDTNYWTPLLGADKNSALIVDFVLNGTSGSALNLSTENSGETPFSYFGMIQGRDSSNADIGPGSFNYLYLGNTNATAPGSIAQLIGSYYSANTGSDHPSESAIWTIDIDALTLIPVWVNGDGSTATTGTFVQSNHVYGGGDSNAFHNRFPAPVSDVTLHLEILSAVPETVGAPEPASVGTLSLGVLGIFLFGYRKRSSCR